MNYIFDTNILVHIMTGSPIGQNVLGELDEGDHFWIISIVTKGEILSIAKQRNWGKKKLSTLKNLLGEFLVVPIDNEEMVEAYAEIDAFSQGKLTNRPSGFSARNMGKNDLWIAATAYLTSATLITTDKDFDHLDNEYLPLEKSFII